MKPTFNPGWLVSLMSRWAARQLAGEAGAIGYPKKACGFSEKTTAGYSHTNPVAFSVRDFSDLDASLELLKNHSEAQFITMMMYYKPWCVNAMRGDGWAFGNSTYFKRLHAAHSFVATQMDDMRKKVEYIHQ